MERYDGKTKKDDYIKYGLITAVVIMILAIIFTANHLVRKHYHTSRHNSPSFWNVMAFAAFVSTI